MKSISMGIVIALMRSARKMTPPFRMLTRIGGSPA
jgi:hypothetical protein